MWLLVWARGFDAAPHAAVEGGEDVCWTGGQESMSLLCAWAAEARRIVTPDLKGLLSQAACWRSLTQENKQDFFVDHGMAAYLVNPEESRLRLASSCVTLGWSQAT